VNRVSSQRARRLVTAAWITVAWSPAAAPATSESAKDLAEIGDWVQILIPASGYVGTWITRDKQGAYQLTKALAGAGLSAHLFKQVAERGRPDATDARSFPSGHTTAAFGGSEFIRQRWGNAWGVPATVAAAFVGWTRINANKHFRDDVLAGMSNGLMWNWYATTPANQQLDIKPTKLADGYGFEFNYTFDGRPDSTPDADYSSAPRFVYNLEWGPVTQDTNLYASPINDGFPIDLATAETEFDFTSRVTFEHYFAARHEWGLYVAPMELIEFDAARTLTEPALFAGVVFQPDDESQFETRYNFVEIRLSYRYTLIDTRSWRLRVGAGAAYQQSVLDVTQFLGRPSENVVIAQARANLEQIKALGSVRVSYNIDPRWRIDLQADGYPGSDSYLNSALLLNWRASPAWEFGVGFRYLDRDVEDDDISNSLQNGDVILSVTHGFF